MKEDCLFCQIIEGKVPSEKIYETENVLVFRDIYPMAKKHWLVIHKNHTEDVGKLVESDSSQLLDIFQSIDDLAKEKSIKNGYRVVTNVGKHAGQTVFHTHFHMLWGEQLSGFGS